MHYELWEYATGGRVAAFQSEDAALVVVREMIEDGWAPEDLSLGLEADNEGERNGLPPVIEGAALKDRAYQRG